MFSAAFITDNLYELSMSLFTADPAIAVYHSHPDAEAYFSDKDIAGSLHDGRQIYDVDYLVIDVQRDRPNGAKLFRFLNLRYCCVWSDSVQASILVGTRDGDLISPCGPLLDRCHTRPRNSR